MTKRLELDSYMDEEELTTAIQEFQNDDHDAGNSCDHLHLNCVDINLNVAREITTLLRSRSWGSIELEECTGRVDFIMTVIMTQAVVGTVKVTTFGLDRLDEATLFAMAVGMTSSICLEELILSATLTQDDAQILAEGIAKATTLRRLCLRDNTLDQPAAEILANVGLQSNTTLHEFGLVGCGQCDDWLGTLLHSFSDHPSLRHLDLRCLGSGDLEPVASLLERKRCGLTSIDLSFKGGSVETPLDLSSFTTALQNRKAQGLSMSLQHLHLCSLLLTDEDVDCVIDACVLAASSLETLNLSLNKLTNIGIIRKIAPKIANNELRLKNLYLDGNPFHKEGSLALLEAIRTNVDIEKIRVSTEHEDIQKQLDYYGYLNRGGRRLVLVRGKQTDASPELNNDRNLILEEIHPTLHKQYCIPTGLWSSVLGRVNRLDFENTAHQEDVLYCLLRNGPLLFPV